jgi:hypothetical protein
VVEEMDLAHLDEITRQLHFKIEAILTQEASTKVKDYVGRLDREFAPHLPFYLNGLVKLALYLYKLEIPMLKSAAITAIQSSSDIGLQNYKKSITTADRKIFISLFCKLLVSKCLLSN